MPARNSQGALPRSSRSASRRTCRHGALVLWVIASELGMAGCATEVDGRAARDADEPVVLSVEAEPSLRAVPRLGVNLGSWTAWGAEQLSVNVIKNPGFEGVIDRTLVVVRRVRADGFTSEPDQIRPDHFWRGARFDVRTGRAAGASGTVRDDAAGTDGAPSFVTDPIPDLADGDIVALTRVSDDGPPTQWWSRPGNPWGTGLAASADRRAGTPGQRSMSLTVSPGRPVTLVSYLDAIGGRARALLPVTGRWRLSVWTKRVAGTPRLAVTVRRAGAPAFVAGSVPPADDWRETELLFASGDDRSTSPVEFTLEAQGEGQLLLDDVFLGRAEAADEDAGFRPEVVAALATLRPGYLRDWEGQLGDTLANRLAPSMARRATRYRPGGSDASEFGYGLPAFLDLCRRVRVRPWIIVPPTFSDEEHRGLGQFLAARAADDQFDDVLVEFGNENWNRSFRGGAIQEPAAHAAAAARAFGLLRQGTGSRVRLHTVVNGPFVNPSLGLRLLRETAGADLLAVAPYFLYGLPAGLPLAERRRAAFVDDGRALSLMNDDARAGGRGMAVAEVNLHATGGDAPAAERDAVTAGRIGGVALARRLLMALDAGVSRQCVYVLAGYDAWLADRRGFAKVWGLVRDLGPTGRFRPTGLAVVLLNRVMRGDFHRVRVTGASAHEITAAAFRTSDGWSVAIVSASASERIVNVRYPRELATRLPMQLLSLQSDTPEDTNEEQVRVRIVTMPLPSASEGVTLPAYGMVVLTTGMNAPEFSSGSTVAAAPALGASRKEEDP